MLAFAPAAGLAETSDAASKLDKVRCKRVAETGYLAKAKKICHTEREWQEIRDAAKRETRQLQEAAGSNRTSG
jgi:D-alanine-D-alanine ligase-like ATP-grasp enzyme